MPDNQRNPLDCDRFPVAADRRHFLSKFLAIGAAVASIPVVGASVHAQSSTGKAKGGAGRKGKAGGLSDPSQLAKKWLEQFDRDRDRALDETELTAAIQALQQETQQSRSRGGGARSGGGGAGGTGGGRRGAASGAGGGGGKGNRKGKT